MIGPGKYDDIATVARHITQAKGLVLIILGGAEGHGFSVQCDTATLMELPELLEQVASQLREDRKTVTS